MRLIKKRLSYGEKELLGRTLSVDEARYVTDVARRISAILLLAGTRCELSGNETGYLCLLQCAVVVIQPVEGLLSAAAGTTEDELVEAEPAASRTPKMVVAQVY
jgi:hypothetical protein